MQTPLQKLIQSVQKRMSLFPDNGTPSERAGYDAYLNVMNEATKLLQDEKNVITDAFVRGTYCMTETTTESEQRANRYFTENFKP